jgi:hypothetical protein
LLLIFYPALPYLLYSGFGGFGGSGGFGGFENQETGTCCHIADTPGGYYTKGSCTL